MAKAKPKSKRKPLKPREPNDTALIRECVAFAQNVAANSAGYNADPTDSEFAAKMGARFSDRSEVALCKMAELPATTPEGLDAKARVVPIVMDNAADSPDEREIKFFTSFARDVREVLKPIIHERFAAAKREKVVA
jgi:hypothetical protein